MAGEPDNMTLRLLREIRSELGEVRRKQDDLEKLNGRFDAMDRRFDEMRGYVVHALGLGSMNDMKAQELNARMEAGEAYRKRVDERFSDIERRLTRVEERID